MKSLKNLQKQIFDGLTKQNLESRIASVELYIVHNENAINKAEKKLYQGRYTCGYAQRGTYLVHMKRRLYVLWDWRNILVSFRVFGMPF